MKKILALVLVLVMCLSLFAGCSKPADNGNNGGNAGNAGNSGNSGNSGSNDNSGSEASLEGTYDVTLWVSEKEGVADLTKQQIAAFMDANPGIVINASIEGVTEADAGSKVVADVASAPDIYCFAQDQLARLVQAAALAPLGTNAAKTVTESNDAGSVAAATIAGTLYAYPLTSDNGYYMYYDTSIISEEDAESLEAIIAACEANNLKFRFALENAWYNAAFFFATGCHSNWTTNEAGEFVSVDDTLCSAEGMIAMKGMQKLAQSPCYDSNADIFTDAAVVITGIWAANDAAAYFGDNLGATDLPSFEVDGTSYHLGSYTGYKLMGVKPQSDAKKQAVLSLLAQYLTNSDCQLERYNQFQWGPSNLVAQASEAVQSNVSLAAFAKQGAYGIPQGQIGAPFWDSAKLLGAVAKSATSDADLQAGLDAYKSAVDAFISLTPEQRNAFTVIGGIGGSSWDTDFEMVEDPAGTWTSKEAFDLTAGNAFKVRKGMGWDIAYGDNTANADNTIPLSNKPDYIVEADGKYYIQLVLGDNDTAVINLVPAE